MRVDSSPAPTVWLTGLSGSGKSTLAHEIYLLLTAKERPCCVLDGDTLRDGLSSDLGHSAEDRREQARRAAEIAAMLAGSKIIPVVALISPFAKHRLEARLIIERRGGRFVEVWVNTPLTVCQARDTKGLYGRARRHGDENLPGVGVPYEAPTSDVIEVAGYGVSPQETAAQLIGHVLSAAPPHTLDDES